MNARIEDNSRVAPQRTLAGGLVATVVVTAMMYFGASMMLGAPMDIAGELGAMLNVPWLLGMVMHFMTGTVIFSFAYALVVGPRLPGHAAIRGMIWGFVLWLIAMLAMSPMMGKGFFMGAMPPAVVSLMGHLAYGVVLGLMVPVSSRQ
ncbi:MAG: hypothetical protein KZQ99_17035 [Candidatus Thiodiazotropha sp. (ex Dulcina madagascariensis)]|nr:hypothetical protein [Candidatus Thiodiazotropha sp. (ex Dulcina madagascariensis)]